MPTVPWSKFTHGQAGYTYYGCKCDVCRAANATRARKQKNERLARVAAGETKIPHGRGGYTNYGCKCEVCTEANSVACRTYRQARIAKRKGTVT